MWSASGLEEFARRRGELKGAVAFVPTMGALHAGHIRLAIEAAKLAPHVIVSIFVNPTQFGPHEDFSRYPRPLEKDLEMCRAAGVAGVFNPGVADMYPAGGLASEVTIPALASILEGAFRPGHFAGVCRVVTKLFNVVRPDVALFGQKDLQQLRVIQAMVADLNMPVRIVPVATVREADGLAMSSRNVYLSVEERGRAVGLSKALGAAAELIGSGETGVAAVEAAMRRVVEGHGMKVDYAVVRHPRTLAELERVEPAKTGGVAALITARLGPVRLLDNAIIGGELS